MNNQRSPYVFVEPFAGSAALTYWLLGGKPPISYMGGKSGYAAVIADILGLSQRHKPAGIILGEPGPFAAVHATLGGASGSAEDVAGWMHANALSMVKDGNASGYSRVNGEGNVWISRSGEEEHWQPTTVESTIRRLEPVNNGNKQAIANIIRSWKDEEPRALWERLKAKGWPSLLLPEGCRGRWLGPQSVEEVAEWLWKAGHGDFSQPPRLAAPYAKPEGNTDGSWKAPPRDWLATRAESLPAFPALAVWQGVAEDLPLPQNLSGVVVYMDPPYQNTSGYKHGTCDRETVLRLARDWSGRGATVAISEAVRLDHELGSGWHAVQIDHARRGQKRTFSKQQDEWVTLNRPPQHVPPKQVGLFA